MQAPRLTIWLLSIVAAGVVFWAIVWPEVLLGAVTLGFVLGAIVRLQLRRDFPRARAFKPDDSTWRRLS